MATTLKAGTIQVSKKGDSAWVEKISSSDFEQKE